MRPTPRVGHVEATVHGRYLLRAAAGADSAPLLVGFHGYGEDAAENLEAMEAIPGVRKWHLASIQALHPFYTRAGDVVASWMTKLDRERAIAANVDYVRRAIGVIRARVEVGGPLVLSGFSQGASMAWRAAALSVDDCRGVIALAGDAPSELGRVEWRSRPDALIGRGDRDGWYSADKLEADLALLAAVGIAAETCVFDGGHEWADEFYAVSGRFLRDLRGAAAGGYRGSPRLG